MGLRPQFDLRRTPAGFDNGIARVNRGGARAAAVERAVQLAPVGAARGALYYLGVAWVGVGLGVAHPRVLARPEFWAGLTVAAIVGALWFPFRLRGRFSAQAAESVVALAAGEGTDAGVGQAPLHVGAGRRRRLLLGPAILALLVVLATPWAIQALTRPPIPVLTYHRLTAGRRAHYPVPTVSPTDFARQVRYLHERGYQTIGLSAFARYCAGKPVALPPKPVLITFDDGWRDTYKQAYPLLKEYGYSAAVFVVTRAVGRDLMLTWDQVRSLGRAGFDIGSHTANHVNLSRISDSEALNELEVSRRELQRQLGTDVESFCFPYGGGDLERRSKRLLRQAGYRLAFGSHAFGLNAGRADLLGVRRVLILHNPLLAQLELELMAP